MSPDSHSHPDWTGIDTVLLDLDGTLLDQAYDNHIWRDLVPQRFAVANSLEMHAAYAEIKRRFAERSGTLDWYCIEYWSRDLGIDIGALHREVRSHVAWLPGAREFLERMRASGKRLVLLTNSHPTALAVKHEQTGVLDLFDAAASSQEFGAPKEQAEFWRAARLRFAGSILAAFLKTPGVFLGDTYLLPSVAAVVLGGTALTGGVGSVVASAVAALFLTQLGQLVLSIGAPTSIQLLIQSATIAIGMGLRGIRPDSLKHLLGMRPRSGEVPAG